MTVNKFVDKLKEDLPEKWEVVNLEKILSRITNGTTEKQSQEPGGYRVTRIETISHGVIDLDRVRYLKELDAVKKEKFTLQEGDVLFSHINSDLHLGKTAVVQKEKDLIHGMNLLLLRFNEEVEPKFMHFLFNLLRSRGEFIAIAQHAVNQSSLNQGKIKALEVALPPLEQQKRIVAKIEELFSHIDAGIEALNKAKQLLKQYRQSVLKAAVTGKLTEQWRSDRAAELDAQGRANAAGAGSAGAATKDETAQELLERILQERRQKWEAQQLEQFKAKGKMPKDDKWKGKYKEAIRFDADFETPSEWVGVTTDEVFYYITSGSRGWAKYYSEEGAVFLRMGNLEHYDVRLDLEDIQRVNPPEGAEGSRTKVKQGDSLISITADVGMVGIVPDGFEEAYINQHVSLARPVIQGMGLYLAWLLSGDIAKEQFKSLQRGATKVGLGLDDIRAIQFGLPSLEEQKEIVRLIEEKLSAIEHLDIDLDQQLVKAGINKQSVLSSSFAGTLL